MPEPEYIIPSIKLEKPYQIIRKANFIRTQTRSTYTSNNAEVWVDIFNELIDSDYKLEKAVPWGTLGLKPSSLYIKITDALKWLADQEREILKTNPQAPSKYNILKNSYKICKEDIGVTFRVRKYHIPVVTTIDLGDGRFLDTKVKSVVVKDKVGNIVDTPEQQQQVNDRLSDQIIRFLENSEEGQIKIIECEVVTDSDRNMLSQMFAELGGTAEYLIDGKTITIMKMV